MSATLGGLIKDLRIQKNVSQLEIALALGWKESSRLSRIEQGRVEKPNRQLLDEIMTAMKLTTEERNRLYIAGNYLPTLEDVRIARQKLAPIIDGWPYPAAALDYTWRVISSNSKLNELYQINYQALKVIEAQMPNILEIIFTPEFIGSRSDKNFYVRLLAHFQYAQQSRTKERWYIDLVKHMMNNDYFRELWLAAYSYRSEDFDIFNFAEKTVNNLSFYNMVMPVFNDTRFLVEYYLPANKTTHQFYEMK